MTKQQILKKAIEKAQGNGYITDWLRNGEFTTGEQYGTIVNAEGVNDIIFSHDFAKAFWKFGDFTNPKGKGYYGAKGPIENWQYHLQQLAIAEDRIKYLEQFL